MTRLEGSQLAGGGNLLFPSTKFEDQGSTIIPLVGGAPLTGGDGGDAGEDALVPFISYTQPINDQLTFGLTVNVPFGLATEYDETWKGRYHAIRSEIETININPALAYKISEKFSIGGGVSIQHVNAIITNAVDFGTICVLSPPVGVCPVPGVTPQGNDGKAKLDVDETSLGGNFGFLWEPSSATRVGVHYRSAFTHKLEGDSEIRTRDPGAAAVLGAPVVKADAEADITFPATISISAYHELNPQWAIMGDVTQTRWRRLPELRVKTPGAPDTVITLDLEDVERYAFGAIYMPNGQWTYRFGIAFDETPVPNASVRTPRLPDEDRIWYTFGFNYQKDDRMSFDFAYAFIDIDDAKISKSTTDPENLFRGNLIGEYEADLSIVSAQVNRRFQTR